MEFCQLRELVINFTRKIHFHRRTFGNVLHQTDNSKYNIFLCKEILKLIFVTNFEWEWRFFAFSFRDWFSYFIFCTDRSCTWYLCLILKEDGDHVFCLLSFHNCFSDLTLVQKDKKLSYFFSRLIFVQTDKKKFHNYFSHLFLVQEDLAPDRRAHRPRLHGGSGGGLRVNFLPKP